MLKRIATTFILLTLFVGVSKAQWSFDGIFPPANPDTSFGSTHGLAVDPDGKVWYSNYYNDETIVNTDGDTVNVGSIHVINPDGTPADFSPIKTVSISAFVSDTLWGNTRGMRADADGNILLTTSGQFKMYRINYKTGEGMNILDFSTTPLGANSPTSPAVDDAGNIYVAPVVPGLPLIVLDKDFNYINTAIEATIGFSRAFEISKDGNKIFWAGYTNGAVYVYERPDEFSVYDSVATVLNGFHSESFAWNPASGDLYLSAGSYADLPSEGYTPGTWYAYNVAQDAVVDSFTWQFGTAANPNERPRAIGFSPDGTIAYVSTFGSNANVACQKFVNPNIVGISKDDEAIVNDFKLSQNYPNPFNPTTTIQFSIKTDGFVSLKIYDMLGREVAVLVDKEMTSGQYTAEFNAVNLASGTYIYELKTSDVKLSKKMLLLK